MFARAVCLFIGLGLVNGSAAQTAAPEETGPWFGHVKFGYLATSGNTENSNMNSSFQLEIGRASWRATV